MSVFAAPVDPRWESALDEARSWCEGHMIDDKPAYAHAVGVARVLDDHLVDLAVEVAIAGLLHNSPGFAPADLDLTAHLTTRYGHPVPRIVRARHAERELLNAGDDPDIDITDLLVLQVSTAAKIVAFGSRLDLARRSGDEARFFADRPELAGHTPYFQRFASAVTGLVPDTMSAALRDVLAALTACRIA